jgi:hypothetical protein
MNKRLKIALRIVPVLLLSGILLVAATRPAVATVPGNNTLASVNNSGNGQGGNDDSDNMSISKDGRYIAFTSWASNLVPGDTNSKNDVFVRDLQNNTTTRVSVSSSGVQANNNSQHPHMSPGGRYVVFASQATNLIDSSTQSRLHVYVHDLHNNTTDMVDVTSSGSESNGSGNDPVISEDGRFISFSSYGTDLVANDTNTKNKIFVKDRTLGTTKLISVATNGGATNDSSYSPSMSCDGAFLTFISYASNLTANDTNGVMDVFLSSRVGAEYITNLTESASVGTGSAEISCNGSYVGLATEGILVATDTDTQLDAYVYERINDVYERINISSSGTLSNADVNSTPSVTDDGRHAIFSTPATNMGFMSGGVGQVYIRDRVGGTTELLSRNTSAQTGNSSSNAGTITPSGSRATFSSFATNLVTSDTNNKLDIFVAETGL